jgi:urease accessory protein
MKIALRTGLVILAAVMMPGVAHAHVGVGDTPGFMHGFAHPIGGIDHVLAMIAVGMFAAYLGGRALWLVPATFVLAMAAGGALGIAGMPVPFVELGIAASVIVLGLAIALQWSVPTTAATALVGFFAIFHGHAHGVEMPADASGLAYALGFMLATAILHVVGLGIALAGHRASRIALQAGGGAMALAGAAILTGYL